LFLGGGVFLKAKKSYPGVSFLIAKLSESRFQASFASNDCQMLLLCKQIKKMVEKAVFLPGKSFENVF
jgi:hypothetical protein